MGVVGYLLDRADLESVPSQSLSLPYRKVSGGLLGLLTCAVGTVSGNFNSRKQHR